MNVYILNEEIDVVKGTAIIQVSFDKTLLSGICLASKTILMVLSEIDNLNCLTRYLIVSNVANGNSKIAAISRLPITT